MTAESAAYGALLSIGAIAGYRQDSLFYLGHEVGDPVGFQTSPVSASLTTAKTSSGYTANTWQHACGVVYSTTSRAAFLNGQGKGVNTANVAMTGANSVIIGTRPYGGLDANSYAAAHIAEVGIWNVALTDDEIACLAKGFSPSLIRPQSLVFYAPLIRDLIDVKGGLALTPTGTTVSAHPRILH